MIVEVVKPESNLYEQFNSLLKKGNVIVLYYANWCPHCVSMKPSWDEFKNQCASNPKYSNLKVAEVESEYIGNTNAANEAQGFPTIKFYKTNKSGDNVPPESIDFQEERTSDNLLNFTVKNTELNTDVAEKKVVNNNMIKKAKSQDKKGKKTSKSQDKKTKKAKLLPSKNTKTQKKTLRKLVFGK